MGNNKKKRTVLQRWLRGRKVHPIQGRTALRSTVLMRPDDHRTYRYAKKRRDWKFFSRVPKGNQEHSNFTAEGLVAPKNEKEALSTRGARASSAGIPSRVEAMRNPRRHRRKRVLLLLMVGLLILLLG